MDNYHRMSEGFLPVKFALVGSLSLYGMSIYKEGWLYLLQPESCKFVPPLEFGMLRG